MTRKQAARRILLLGSFLALLVAIAAALLPQVAPERIAAQERTIRAAIAAHHWRALGAGLAVYTLVSLVPGTSGKSILAGWLYGFGEGLLIVTTGLTIAAMCMFLVSRHFFRDAIRARLSARLVRWDRALATEGVWFLLSVRWAHSPFTMVNYACGVSSISVRVFLWTTLLGVLPGSAVFVWMGSRLPTLERLVAGGASAFLDPWLGTALASTALLPVVVRWYVVRRRQRTEVPQAMKADGWKTCSSNR